MIRALDPADGKRLWGGSSGRAIGLAGDGLVYFDSGRGGLGVAVDQREATSPTTPPAGRSTKCPRE